MIKFNVGMRVYVHTTDSVFEAMIETISYSTMRVYCAGMWYCAFSGFSENLTSYISNDFEEVSAYTF